MPGGEPILPILELIPHSTNLLVLLCFQKVTGTPFCNLLVFMVFHVMGGGTPPFARADKMSLAKAEFRPACGTLCSLHRDPTRLVHSSRRDSPLIHTVSC